VRTKLLVDARGAASPYASADLVCPTVGGVMTGLDEGTGPRQQDPTVGEILATTETLLAGQQHLWEAFPGHPGQTTVYLFYYTWAKRFRPGDLLELYARFFERLPLYRAGNAALVAPTFGLIPGWSRLTPAPRAPGRRVLLVGDAAARHSPLTYCGFGDLVRSLDETLERITTAATSPRGLEDTRTDAVIHGGTGLLAAMMAEPPADPEEHGAVNRLLDTAFSTLHAMPNDAYARLLRDELSGKEFVTFLRATAKQRPEVYRSVFERLGPAAVAKWGMNLAQGFFAS
jgi:lycopene cyclase CruA